MRSGGTNAIHQWQNQYELIHKVGRNLCNAQNTKFENTICMRTQGWIDPTQSINGEIIVNEYIRQDDFKGNVFNR